MESQLRQRAEELVRKRINDCISPEAINEAITAITVDLYNLYLENFLFGAIDEEDTTETSKSKGNAKRRNGSRKASNLETEGAVRIDCVGKETLRKERIQKSLGIVCNGTEDHNHLLCPLKSGTERP